MPRHLQISPTNSLFFLKKDPCPCEQQTAALIDKTFKSIDINDIRAVSYRYLQICAGEKCTFIEFSIATSLALIFLSQLTRILYQIMDGEGNLASHLSLILLYLIPLSASTFDAFPNACNTFRYGQIRRESAAWLTQKLGEETFAKINAAPYNSSGFFKVKAILDNLNIPNAESSIPGKFKMLIDTTSTRLQKYDARALFEPEFN